MAAMDRLSEKAIQTQPIYNIDSGNDGQNTPIMREMYLILYELGRNKEHGLTDDQVREIQDITVRELIIYANLENWDLVSTKNKIPFDYYTTDKYEENKKKIDEVLQCIPRKLRAKFREFTILYDKNQVITALKSRSEERR